MASSSAKISHRQYKASRLTYMLTAPAQAQNIVPENNPYLARFNEHYNQHHDFRQAISSAVSLFLSDSQDASNPLHQELTNYLELVKIERFGRIVHKRKFLNALPQSLINLFTITDLIEQAAFCAPNQLLSDCENQIAAGAYKPQVVCQQAARIEAAIVDKQFEQRHLFIAKNNLIELIASLYGSFAELILESKDIASLNSNVALAFDEKLVEHLPLLKNFRVEVDCQIEFLEGKEFLEQFYELTSLADKYEHVISFYQWAKAQDFMTPELKGTLSALQKHILTEAYKSCERKRNSLMRNPTATTEDIFTHLREWIEAGAWRKHGVGELIFELDALLTAEQKQFEAWEKLGERLHQMQRPGKVFTKLPAFQLHCMKFAGDPDQNPEDEIRALDVKILLQSTQSPVKKKRTHEEATADRVLQPTEPNTVMANELIDGMDDDDDDDDDDESLAPEKQRKIKP